MSGRAVNFNCFTIEQVKEINKEIKTQESKKQDLTYTAQNASKIGEFSHVPCGPLIGILHPFLYQCQLANRDIFGYDIYWDFHLEAFNYNVYGIEGEYGWHIDAIESQKYDMKLTCLLNLSEESYEGGKFHVTNTHEEQKFTSGMGLVFTSPLAHKVTPVTKGERITLTYWGMGPSWR
jgi:hypothetical protein